MDHPRIVRSTLVAIVTVQTLVDYLNKKCKLGCASSLVIETRGSIAVENVTAANHGSVL